MLKSVLFAVVLAVTTLLVGMPSKALAGSDLRLEGRLSASGTSMKGKGKYEETSIRTGIKQKFAVEVEAATPNTSYEVKVNGAAVGSFRTNSLGRGGLTLYVGGDNPGQVKSFPRLKPGATVSVGRIGGTLSAR